MIEKFLKPLDKDPEKEKQVRFFAFHIYWWLVEKKPKSFLTFINCVELQISRGLKELRNQMVFSFLMINGIWVVTIFLLQANQDDVSQLLIRKWINIIIILLMNNYPI